MIVLLLFIITVIPGINAETVPEWVKNTAGWWAADEISEKEFVNAIEFLVKSKIIQIDATSSIGNAETVPEWVKNTAGWWAADEISEKEFVNAIEFLVKSNIINISSNDKNFNHENIWNEIYNDESLQINEKILKFDKFFPFLSGYRGATFDGEYVYFSPYYSNHGRHGELIRYNISEDFQDKNSWERMQIHKFEISRYQNEQIIKTHAEGFQGVLYNEPFVYYVPYFVKDGLDSIFLRFDTRMEFSEIEAYSLVSSPHVYEDGIVHKNFVYFSPHLDKNNERETYPLRYDTTKPFTDESSWEYHFLKNKTSYIGAESAMDKIFYAPWETTDSANSTIAIYDTTKPFTDEQSWRLIDIPYQGYTGAAFNGQHIVFPPGWCSIYQCDERHFNFIFLEPSTFEITYLQIPNSSYSGIINAREILYPVPYYLDDDPIFLKMDKFEIESFTPSIAESAYWGGTFDEKYVYYAPYQFVNSDVRSNEFLRYDTTKPFTDESSWEHVKLHLTDFWRDPTVFYP